MKTPESTREKVKENLKNLHVVRHKSRCSRNLEDRVWVWAWAGVAHEGFKEEGPFAEP